MGLQAILDGYLILSAAGSGYKTWLESHENLGHQTHTVASTLVDIISTGWKVCSVMPLLWKSPEQSLSETSQFFNLAVQIGPMSHSLVASSTGW